MFILLLSKCVKATDCVIKKKPAIYSVILVVRFYIVTLIVSTRYNYNRRGLHFRVKTL